MDRLSPASEQRKYSLSKKIAAIAGGLALAAGLGACGSKAEVGALGGSQTTAVATETPGNHLSGENPGISEAPQGEAPAAENAPENIPPEGGLPEVTVPREDVESGQAAPVPENPNGVWEPGPQSERPDFPDIKNMVGSANAEQIEICYAGEGFVVDYDKTATAYYPDGYGTPVGVGNCEGKGYPRLGHGWRQEDDNTIGVCLPVQQPDGLHYYIAKASGGRAGEPEKKVHVTDFGTIDTARVIKNCNPNPGPDDIVSW